MCEIHGKILEPIVVSQLNIGKKDYFSSFVNSWSCKSFHSEITEYFVMHVVWDISELDKMVMETVQNAAPNVSIGQIKKKLEVKDSQHFPGCQWT